MLLKVGKMGENLLLSSLRHWISGLLLWQWDLCIFLLKINEYGTAEGKFLRTYVWLTASLLANMTVKWDVPSDPVSSFLAVFSGSVSFSHFLWVTWDEHYYTCPFRETHVLKALSGGCKLGAGLKLAAGVVQSRFMSARLGFLGLTQILSLFRRLLSIFLPSIPWAGNQSQSSCLATTESGNSSF